MLECCMEFINGHLAGDSSFGIQNADNQKFVHRLKLCRVDDTCYSVRIAVHSIAPDYSAHNQIHSYIHHTYSPCNMYRYK
jgi:hypothetical protein